MKLAESCLKVGFFDLLGCSFQLSGRLSAESELYPKSSFIGIDLNPIAVQLPEFMVSPPPPNVVWQPDLHFEINVWSRFNIRVKRLIRALEKSPFSLPPHHYTEDPNQVLSGDARVAVICDDALTTLNRFASNSVDLILTDPPHGDRVPYLELSQMWNAVLGHQVNFEHKIVVSNAKDRHKGLDQYETDMHTFLNTAADLLKKGGFLVILFNARDSDDWQYLYSFSHTDSTGNSIEYLGHFPVPYSARSVVQDSRDGSLKDDLAIVSRKGGLSRGRVQCLQSLEGWSSAFPTEARKD